MIEARQIGKDGRLGPVTDICDVAAGKYMAERWGLDTNPQIVQMIFQGDLVPHWYYRSDQWVAQPYYLPQYYIPPYVGPAELAPASLYGAGTYIVDKRATSYSRRMVEKK